MLMTGAAGGRGGSVADVPLGAVVVLFVTVLLLDWLMKISALLAG